MEMNEEELKYGQLIRSLKQLSKVKAPENFEKELLNKINSGKFEEEKESFWERFLIPSKLIPSAAVVAAAVILFFVVNVQSDEFENPLLIKPRMREDIPVSAAQVPQVPVIELKKKDEAGKTLRDKEKRDYYSSDLKVPETKRIDKKPSAGISAPEPLGFTALDSISPLENQIWKENDSFLTENAEVPGNYPVFRGTSGEVYQITKSGLNFRQVNIVREEREQIIQLKEKIKSLMNQTGKALKLK
jgi:hypothetical protein